MKKADTTEFAASAGEGTLLGYGAGHAPLFTLAHTPAVVKAMRAGRDVTVVLAQAPEGCETGK